MEMWNAKKARPPKYNMSVQKEIAQLQVNLRQFNLSFNIGINSTEMFSGKATLFHDRRNSTYCNQRRCWCRRLPTNSCNNPAQYTSQIHLETKKLMTSIDFGLFLFFLFSYNVNLTIIWSTNYIKLKISIAKRFVGFIFKLPS